MSTTVGALPHEPGAQMSAKVAGETKVKTRRATPESIRAAPKPFFGFIWHQTVAVTPVTTPPEDVIVVETVGEVDAAMATPESGPPLVKVTEQELV